MVFCVRLLSFKKKENGQKVDFKIDLSSSCI